MRDLVTLKITDKDTQGPSSSPQVPAGNITSTGQGTPGVVQTVSLPPYEDSPWPISTVGAQVNSLPYFSFSPKDSMNTFLFKCSITFLLTGQIPLKWETQTK